MVRPAEYVADEGFSQSDLNTFEKNIFDFYCTAIAGDQFVDKKSEALDLGSLVDNILLDPDNLKNYYVMTDMKASGKEKDVVDTVYKMILGRIQKDIEERKADKDALITSKWGDITSFEKEIIKSIEQIEYQTNWKLETRIGKIKTNGKEYFEQLKEAGTRTIVTMDSWTRAHSIVEQLQEDESTKNVFAILKGKISDKAKKRYVLHKCKALYGTDIGSAIKMKGLLDFYIEDTVEKTIIPFDLKTAKSHAQFMANYRASRYGRQGSYYSELLAIEYPEHTIEVFRFLVIPTESGEVPEIYYMSESELIGNKEGFESNQGFRIPGWKELLKQIAWHKENAKWQHRKEYYERGYNIIKGNMNVDPALLQASNGEVIF